MTFNLKVESRSLYRKACCYKYQWIKSYPIVSAWYMAGYRKTKSPVNNYNIKITQIFRAQTTIPNWQSILRHLHESQLLSLESIFPFSIIFCLVIPVYHFFTKLTWIVIFILGSCKHWKELKAAYGRKIASLIKNWWAWNWNWTKLNV